VNEREGAGKRERTRLRERKDNEREGGSERTTNERATDKPMQMTAGEKEEEGNEIKRSGQPTLIISVRQIDAKPLGKRSR
jgi:hypothetical protein